MLMLMRLRVWFHLGRRSCIMVQPLRLVKHSEQSGGRRRHLVMSSLRYSLALRLRHVRVLSNTFRVHSQHVLLRLRACHADQTPRHRRLRRCYHVFIRGQTNANQWVYHFLVRPTLLILVLVLQSLLRVRITRQVLQRSG